MAPELPVCETDCVCRLFRLFVFISANFSQTSRMHFCNLNTVVPHTHFDFWIFFYGFFFVSAVSAQIYRFIRK